MTEVTAYIKREEAEDLFGETIKRVCDKLALWLPGLLSAEEPLGGQIEDVTHCIGGFPLQPSSFGLIVTVTWWI